LSVARALRHAVGSRLARTLGRTNESPGSTRGPLRHHRTSMIGASRTCAARGTMSQTGRLKPAELRSGGRWPPRRANKSRSCRRTWRASAEKESWGAFRKFASFTHARREAEELQRKGRFRLFTALKKPNPGMLLETPSLVTRVRHQTL
jgi:hypothetical protein